MNTREYAIKEFEEAYAVSQAVQKPFGEAVLEVMKLKGLEGPSAFSKHTGLNRDIYYTMQKPDKNIELNMIISICIGFQLDTVSTNLLLHSAGFGFNMSNRIHRAYLYLIEYYKGHDISECNKILEYLDVPPFKRLGSSERGPYKPREKRISKK
ncbi:MAG: hypothetical protein IJB75_08240 [Oscillospiraceae bacterium]|nr:hypothetical protein [Oscillospiraceae bacterium]